MIDSAAIDSVSEPENETLSILAEGGGSIPPAVVELFFEDAFEDMVDRSVLEPPPNIRMDFLFDLQALWSTLGLTTASSGWTGGLRPCFMAARAQTSKASETSSAELLLADVST